MRTRMVLAAALCACALPVVAQPPPGNATSGLRRESKTRVIKNKDLYERTGYWHPFVRMPKYVLRDQKAIWTSPFHATERSMRDWAIFLGATGTLAAFDEKIQQNAPNPPALVSAGTSGSYLGTYYTLIPLAASFYFIGSKTQNERFREAGLLGFEAMIDATLTGEAIKLVADRQRPLEGTGEGQFFESNNRINSSFPSGHAINTFALTSVFAHEYHDKWWVKVLAYSYAGGVCLARLAANRHFPSDTLAGGAMGWFIGDYVYGHRHNPAIEGKRTAAQKILDHVHFGGAMY
jgi:membrane-associated phospholipid phosphatase